MNETISKRKVKDRLYHGFISTQYIQYDISKLIQHLEKLKQDYSDIYFVFGDSSYGDDLEWYCQREENDKEYTNRISQEEQQKILLKAREEETEKKMVQLLKEKGYKVSK